MVAIRSVRRSLWLLSWFLILAPCACGGRSDSADSTRLREPGPRTVEEALVVDNGSGQDEAVEFPVPMKPLPATITPCRACHGPEKDFQVNLTREEVLHVHTDIRLEGGHRRLWCLDCHHPTEREFLLPLASGQPIPFEHSYELCGKCHATQLRDWQYGVHGKRTGLWNGTKMYYLCVQCHNPHNPAFKALKPMPPPNRPRTPKDEDSGGH